MISFSKEYLHIFLECEAHKGPIIPCPEPDKFSPRPAILFLSDPLKLSFPLLQKFI